MEAGEHFTMMEVSEEQIIRYLLDEMTTDERSSIEDYLEREPLLFEHISSIEDHMILRYVRGELQGHLLSRFTEIYLNSPTRRARVQQAQVLQQAARDAAQSRRTGWWARLFVTKTSRLTLAVASALAVAILAVVLLPLWNNRSSSQDGPVNGNSQTSFTLQPGLVRGEAGAQIVAPPGMKQVQFELTVPGPATRQSYRVLLETPERPAIWSGWAIRKGPAVVTTIPADKLQPGDYTLKLQAFGTDPNGEDVATYFFRVRK